MAIKSNNTQGNPWHSESDGKFTSPGSSDGGEKNNSVVFPLKLKDGLSLDDLLNEIDGMLSAKSVSTVGGEFPEIFDNLPEDSTQRYLEIVDRVKNKYNVVFESPKGQKILNGTERFDKFVVTALKLKQEFPIFDNGGQVVIRCEKMRKNIGGGCEMWFDVIAHTLRVDSLKFNTDDFITSDEQDVISNDRSNISNNWCCKHDPEEAWEYILRHEWGHAVSAALLKKNSYIRSSIDLFYGSRRYLNTACDMMMHEAGLTLKDFGEGSEYGRTCKAEMFAELFASALSGTPTDGAIKLINYVKGRIK